MAGRSSLKPPQSIDAILDLEWYLVTCCSEAYHRLGSGRYTAIFAYILFWFLLDLQLLSHPPNRAAKAFLVSLNDNMTFRCRTMAFSFFTSQVVHHLPGRSAVNVVGTGYLVVRKKDAKISKGEGGISRTVKGE